MKDRLAAEGDKLITDTDTQLFFSFLKGFSMLILTDLLFDDFIIFHVP